ncbi:nicotinate-nucleotide adenylyltransferase [Azohydromonas caseinilytica]|uniref:nicotinate-nucleotide adenylyltransferase n=1 Tax=Azohydromonas caseinilytica TaxID=2728836 RepID=UPI0028734E4D|nr:nicotinate-nucleotide adenylyltransferase [Azohydromonas caseinilytica]
MRRIGLLGGTFDPPHLAHLALARQAREELRLDELRWLPAGQPWQKLAQGRAPSAAAHRVAMLKLLLQGEPGFVIDERELHRSGPSYSIDTLRELASELPGAQLFFVVGQDQYARLHTWRDWRDMLKLVTLAVAGRAGDAPRAPPEVAAVPHRIETLALPPMAVASTDIRARAARGEDLSSLVGPAVAAYIDLNALYRVDTGS